MMRTIVWGINYAPEFTGIAPHSVSLCEFLQNRDDDVSMITTFPYYPSWRKRPEDTGRLYRTDQINGVPVYRCWHFVPQRVSALKRIIHEGSFIFTSTLRALSLPGADVYILVSPPLLLGVAGLIVRCVKGGITIFHVQDMQPDAAVGLGMLKASWFTKVLYRLESFAYRHASFVSGITKGMLNRFREKGVPEAKLIYFPNAIALEGIDSAPPRGEFRHRHGFQADDFLAVYAGNLGVKQGLEILLQAARLVEESRVRIVICGDGAQRAALEESVVNCGSKNIRMLPLQQGRDYRSLLIDADVCFITQQAGAGSLFFPSKLLGILGESKPVITVATSDSDLALSIVEGEFGVNLAPGEAEKLARLLDSLANDPGQLAEYGIAGRRYVEQFDRVRVMQSFVEDLDRARRLERPRIDTD